MKEYIFTLSGVIIGVLFAIILAFVLSFNGCSKVQPRSCYLSGVGYVDCNNLRGVIK